jgi:hypothetical protein
MNISLDLHIKHQTNHGVFGGHLISLHILPTRKVDDIAFIL